MTALQYAILAITVASALIGLKAATVEIRDNLDQFINDLARQGRWQKWGAIANLLGAAGLIASQVLGQVCDR